MVIQTLRAGVDELLDRAGDAVARNEWALAKQLAEAVLQQNPYHAEAALVLRTAAAYLETDHPQDPFSSSRNLRFMSIMFCDVVGSTRLARQLGDVVWGNTLEAFRRRCARAVRRYDGYIHEATGDELLILFGYPRVREDDARRAVLAGLDIIAAIQAFSALLEREHGFPFHARVGIHTGRALIRERTPSGALSADSNIGGGLVGDAANVAKRIESAAKPDTVWVSVATRRIVEGFFEFVDTSEGEKQLDLPARPPLAAYQVGGPTAALNRHQIARVRSDQIVGRRTERARLLELWDKARTHGAPLVVVSGPAGIGKSRLVEFLAETAAASRASRLECICTEILKPIAFAPLIGLFERFANIRQTDSPDTRVTKLDAAFGSLAPQFAQFLPYIAWMMSIRRADHPQIDDLEPEATRNKIFDILLRLLTLVGARRPLVLWIEDVQWADHSTLEFCRQLETHGPIPGVMVVATLRTTREQPHAGLPWSNDEVSVGRCLRVELDALSPAESRHLIASRSGTPLRDELTDAILESTGGNPLYIEEVVRAVAAGGDARQKVDGVEPLSIGIPETLQPIFAQIVDRLGDDRHIAQIASLLGRELPEPLTRTVVAAILGLGEREIVEGLTRLIDAEIIEPILTELSPGYRFRHELIREALAYSLGPDATENHGRIAKVIEQSFPEIARERPAVLAYHFAKAEQHLAAAFYRLTAGRQLQAKAAHHEAVASFDQGLESLAVAGDRLDPVAAAKIELALCACRGVSVQTTKGYSDAQAGRDWSRAYDLSKQIGTRTDFVPALGGLWSFYFVRGARTFAAELNTTSVDVAEQIIEAAGDECEARIIGHTCLAYAQYFAGSLTAGRNSAERSWQLRQQGNERPPDLAIPQDPALAALSLLGPVRWSLGDQLGGLRAAEEAMALATALESKRAINIARVGQTNAWLHQIRRDYAAACRAADDALTVAREFHVDWAVVNLSIHRALAMAHCGSSDADRRDARGLARQNLGYWRASGAETMVPYFLGELAQACHAAGDGTMALDLVNEAIDVAVQNHEHFYDAELYRTRAQVWLARAGDERDAGIADLRRAVEVASQQHAVSFEIRALVALLTVAGELPDRQTCLDELQRALRSLESSEHGTDERTARLLVQQESR